LQWRFPFPSLIRREAEILSLLSQRLNNRENTMSLHVSPETVKLDLKHIYRKLGVSNRVQASVLCIKNGFSPSQTQAKEELWS
jgi:DNA-binding CsgD family transcriptional regulator